MEIITRPELRGFIPKVESALEAAINKRRELGLSIPENYEVHIDLFGSEGAAASATDCSPRNRITVHVATSAMYALPPRERQKFLEISKFFYFLAPYFGSKERVMEAIENPTQAVREFRKIFSSEEELRRYEARVKELGRTAQSYNKFARVYAKFVRRWLKEALPSLEIAFNNQEIRCLPHELDHLDMYGTSLYRNHAIKSANRQKSAKKVYENLSRENSAEHAEDNQKYLASLMGVVPILEMRALFFDYFKSRDIKNTDFEQVGKNVLDHFKECYINYNLVDAIIDPLVSGAWSRGEMDRQTSNYVFRTIFQSIKSSNLNRYKFNPQEVNYAWAAKILEKEFPERKEQITFFSEKVIKALVQGYREDPALLHTGPSETAGEYLDWVNSQISLKEAGRWIAKNIH